MGRFLNPDNGAFSEAVNSEIYIDKTRLLEYINRVINTTSKFICNSRPRRFGKSMTADMLSAYYSRGCDSKELFKNYEISTVSSYEKNLNKYDVIHFDVQWCMMDAEMLFLARSASRPPHSQRFSPMWLNANRP